jgi:hypothetical protein
MEGTPAMSELEVSTRKMPALDWSKVPAPVVASVDFGSWASSLLRKTPYAEPIPDYISTMLAYQTITAATLEDVFKQANIQKMQEQIANVPDAGTGPIEITDLYVAESDFETGNPSYVIITATVLDTGETWKRTTGATNIQATLLALLRHGVWPIRCQIKRGDSKDKGGRYLLFVLPPD